MNTANSFFKAINEASGEMRNQMLAELEDYRTKQLAEANAAAEKKYNAMLSAAAARIDGEDGVLTQQKVFELKKEVSDMRRAIAENVFSCVKDKLHAFTKTAEYRQFLINSAENMLKKCGEHPITIYIKIDDADYGKELSSLSSTISIKTDDSIQIGGIYGVCEAKNIRLNDLLEVRLEEQKEWFYQNSSIGGV